MLVRSLADRPARTTGKFASITSIFTRIASTNSAMTIHTDPNAAHAVFAPSSADRWIPCTASAEAIARLPEQEEGEEAAEGHRGARGNRARLRAVQW
jgi:hypothetical protein